MLDYSLSNKLKNGAYYCHYYTTVQCSAVQCSAVPVVNCLRTYCLYLNSWHFCCCSSTSLGGKKEKSYNGHEVQLLYSTEVLSCIVYLVCTYVFIPLKRLSDADDEDRIGWEPRISNDAVAGELDGEHERLTWTLSSKKLPSAAGLPGFPLLFCL